MHDKFLSQRFNYPCISTAVCQLIHNTQATSRHVGQSRGAAAAFPGGAQGEVKKDEERKEKTRKPKESGKRD